MRPPRRKARPAAKQNAPDKTNTATITVIEAPVNPWGDWRLLARVFAEHPYWLWRAAHRQMLFRIGKRLWRERRAT